MSGQSANTTGPKRRSLMNLFSPLTIEQLQFYVYALYDPRDKWCFGFERGVGIRGVAQGPCQSGGV